MSVPGCVLISLFNSFPVSELYVEVDHVRAKVIHRDICVLTGVIHIVDTVLGYPKLNVYNAIYDNDELMYVINCTHFKRH